MKRAFLRATASSAVIFLTRFSSLGSSSVQCGGAVFFDGPSFASVRFSEFYRCRAQSGGGVGVSSGAVAFSTSFFEECSAIKNNNNGGNAILFERASITLSSCLFLKSAPSRTETGDAVVMGISGKAKADNVNFSKCEGRTGQCSIGIYGEDGRTDCSFINIVTCKENDIISGQYIYMSFSNIVNNTLLSELFYSYITPYEIVIFRSNLFGNVRTNGATVRYIDCIGDLKTSGVSSEENYVTFSIINPLVEISQLKIISRNKTCILGKLRTVLISFLQFYIEYEVSKPYPADSKTHFI